MIKVGNKIVVTTTDPFPDFKIMLRPGFSTYWNVYVRYRTWYGVFKYKNYEVQGCHSKEEAVTKWHDEHGGTGYNYITKEKNPEYFV